MPISALLCCGRMICATGSSAKDGAQGSEAQTPPGTAAAGHARIAHIRQSIHHPDLAGRRIMGARG
ncbi:hypothetical protein [Gemmobacter serpentinus]|uniref:hypothetical protein n=1 Tax=Gemmobacter serpentinus TaxID=2652247 RepID=UPI00124E3A1F|nr:hypothetical protein [Gemmobacter serpentinus]